MFNIVLFYTGYVTTKIQQMINFDEILAIGYADRAE